MIVNPSRHPHLLVPYVGTRLLQQDFGLIGEKVPDAHIRGREWTIDGAYAPLRRRRVQGVRFRAYDQLGFVSFIEQMELELLLGIAKPGSVCSWSGVKYRTDAEDLYGFSMDDDDNMDDLLDIETAARGGPEVILPDGAYVERKLHRGKGEDCNEGWTLVWDGDPETGASPDLRLETVCTRWKRVEYRRVIWEAEYRDSQLDAQAFNYRQWRKQNSSPPATRAASARKRSTSPTR